ncbi:hypothetical protein Pmani_022415 [Petrolisthes manimaculis]|uniref:Uncharacterized protein n=1 Tax=Petrolisthes manimaculis TaxID=1843537 RepID=A0AAE1PCS6_9EUCA|nr:hypothetical protein Pmani_022415 [Petrolisthes manimaculis]
MSVQLMKFLLADARDVKDSGPSPYEGDNNLTLAIQRHGPSHVLARNRNRNRLSLDLEQLMMGAPSKVTSPHDTHQPQVVYRRSGSDQVSSAAATTKRHSSLLDYHLDRPTRSVRFDLPESPEAARRYLRSQAYPSQNSHESHTRHRMRPPDRREDSPSDNNNNESLEGYTQTAVGISPRLRQLLEIKPRDYGEAQRLKKMLKRAVSRPDTTFEDLKVYRLAMKRLRRIVRQEQEKEMMMQAQAEHDQEFQQFIDKVP